MIELVAGVIRARYKRVIDNQEDSVMMNLSAIQRGLFCLTTYRSLSDIEKKRDTYSYEKICLPPKNSETRNEEHPDYFKRKGGANYSLLDENGRIRQRTKKGQAIPVRRGDVVIGKVLIRGTKSGEEKMTDISRMIQPGEEGIIDRVHIFTTPSGYKLVKIVIRQHREPELGDKLAARSAQKATIGMLYRQEDMPFTASGIVPDIIINPLAIPSRMTVNQLLECVLGKGCCFSGEFGDVTPFTEFSVNSAENITKKFKREQITRMAKQIEKFREEKKTWSGEYLNHHGWEKMTNGMTGELMDAKIFIGPTYYQRLKHMVKDKMHARATGHVTILTRQPLEGLDNHYIKKTTPKNELKDSFPYKKMEEIFKKFPLQEYKNRYLVSSNGKIWSNRKKGYLNMVISNKFYVIWVNKTKSKKRLQLRVDKLVAEAFLGPSKDFLVHIDENNLNNCVNNLRWSDIPCYLCEKYEGKWKQIKEQKSYYISSEGKVGMYWPKCS